MANKKISEFPELDSGSVTNTDVLPIVNDATNKKFSWSSIKTALSSVFLQKSSNLSDVTSASAARNNILPSKTSNALKVLRVNSGETDYELATSTDLVDWGDIGGTLSNQTDLQTALNARELLSNKATDLSSNDNTHYPTTAAVKSAIDSAVAGLLDYRGVYNANTNVFPSTGGSGSSGAILKGDCWFIGEPGTLGGTPVNTGDLLIANTDTPGQTAGNWNVVEQNFGYTPENVANKDTDGTLSANSDTKYASQKATKTYADTKIASSYLDTDGTLSANSDSKIATQKATKTYADTKIASSYLDTDGTLAANSDTRIATQKATKTYVDTIVNPIQQSPAIKIFGALGSEIVAEPWWGHFGLVTQGVAMTSQRLHLHAIWLEKPSLITGVAFSLQTSGVYTANNYNGVGLFTYSGGTLTLVASSTSDGNIWKGTAFTINKKAFSSAYTAAAGLYFIGLLYSSSAVTTAPALFAAPDGASNIQSIMDFSNSAKVNGYVGSRTSLPSTQAMSGVTSSGYGTRFYAGLYVTNS